MFSIPLKSLSLHHILTMTIFYSVADNSSISSLCRSHSAVQKLVRPWFMVLCFFSYRFALLFFLSASSYLLELKVVLWQSCDSDRALEMSACLDDFRVSSETRFPGHGDSANSGITHPRALAYGYEFSGAPHSTLRLFLVHLHMVGVALGVPALCTVVA